MRKHEQRQIQELLQTIGQAQSEGMYADCQEGAIAAGEYIESIEGEGTRTVALLEEYCDELYRISIGEIDVKRLEKSFACVCESVRADLKPNRIEVAFLPYKRAMSDSLESVWQVALNDPQCDAYIVPVPYYDRLPGGAFGQMHYEGDLYPPGLPITDWREYDIEARHPDIIFIHYPYDDDNYVTSLHPNFYSKRLKAFTDLLVYIPYFVCVDDVPEHFCVCAGTLYADRVIVQSEKVRQTYINAFKKFERENKCKGRFGKATDKFVALGSPKFDAAISAKRENFTLPDEWAGLIGDKKVIFFNTTISAILSGNERYLEKLRSVLDLFRKRDDVVLWWRPHPLTEATLQSMRPQFSEEYEHIIEDYKRGGWGIYDDTSDLHRAIAWSDVYYGDWGSVVALFFPLGKPMIVNNSSLGAFSNQNIAVFCRLCDDGEYLWFVAESINALFRMKKNIWEPQFMGIFPADGNSTSVFRGMCIHGRHLYFAPKYHSGVIQAFDIENKGFISIPYKSELSSTQDFIGVVTDGDYVYFTPCRYPAIIRLNTTNNEIDYYSDWVNSLKALITDEKDALFLYPLKAETHNSIYLASACANAVVEFDMSTAKSTVYEVGKKHYRYSGICFDGENYWLTPRRDTQLVKWHPQKGVIAEINLPSEQTKSSYFPAVYNDGFIWIYPNAARHVIIINIVNYEIEVIELLKERWPRRITSENYLFAQKVGDSCFAYSGADGTLLEMNSKSEIQNEKQINFSEEIMKNLKNSFKSLFKKRLLKCNNMLDFVYRENNAFVIEDFLNFLSENDMGNYWQELRQRQLYIFSRSVENKNSAGISIYKYCNNIMRIDDDL